MNFKLFKQAVQQQFDLMLKQDELYVTDLPGDDLWETYLTSFPADSNPIYRERTEHDCSCCKHFIRQYGNLVAIADDYTLMTIWDNVELNNAYSLVARAMAEAVNSSAIRTIFRTRYPKAGTDYNHETPSQRWDHFYLTIPSKYVVSDADTIGSRQSAITSKKGVFKRGLEELSLHATDTVLELIAQGSLYRGSEHKNAVQYFHDTWLLYQSVPDELNDNFCWLRTKGKIPIRNTAIGSLLIDLSADVELDSAVSKFESVVAPLNYKRPKALVTAKMIDNARSKVSELGYESALQRRYANEADLTVNNVIFADKSASTKVTDAFSLVEESTVVSPKTLKKVEEVSLADFLTNIVPSATSIELLFENRHTNNLMSLIAPSDPDSKNMLMWNNNFSWTYNNDVTDSIKERVKSAGGKVDGYLRCSLSWSNSDDLDIHVREPSGNVIYYSNKCNRLDVDMNAGGIINSVNPVENVTWPSKQHAKPGEYIVLVNNFTKRSGENQGFGVEIECNGETFLFEMKDNPRSDATVEIATFTVTESGIEINKSISSTSSTTTTENWSIGTNKFHKVTLLLNSPNHWDDNETGNKHTFFVLENCTNPDEARGLYNEFLDPSLREHRKVFEILGSKLKVAKTNHQLSGLGFSETKRNSVYCKVAGSFTRTIKILL